MPAPVVVYVLAGVATVGAVIAFHEFVYTPHIAPHVGRWKADFMAKHFPRRGGPVPVSSEAPSPDDSSIPLKRRGGKGSDKSSDTDTDSEDDDNDGDHNGMRQRRARGKGSAAGIASSIELEDLVASELREWRSTTSAIGDFSSSLRQRKNREGADHDDVLGESTISIPYITMSPTHVLVDSSAPTTPTSTGTLRSRMSTPPAFESSPLPGSSPPLMSQVSDSHVTLVSPPSTISSSLTSPHQSSPAQPSPLSHPLLPEYIPSLSQSYPQDLDHEHGLELLSPPSSRSESPFSVLSGSGAANSPWMPIRATPSPLSALRSGAGATSPSARPTNNSQSPPPGLLRQGSDGWTPANPAYQQQQNQALESSTASITSQYHSFPSSPAVSGSMSNLSNQGSGFSSPSTLSSPLQDQATSQRSLSALSSPSPITFTSPNPVTYIPQRSFPSTAAGQVTSPRLPLSASQPRSTLVFGTATEGGDSYKEESEGTPRSPRSPVSPHFRGGGDLSDLDFMSDLDDRSDAGRVSSPHGFFDVGNFEHGRLSASGFGENQVLSPMSQTFLDVRQHDGDDPRSPFSDFGDLESENGFSDSGMSDSSWGSVVGGGNGGSH